MKLFLFLALLTPMVGYCDVVASLGVEGSPVNKSETHDPSGKSYIDRGSLFGFRGDLEGGFKYLTFNVSGSYLFGKAKTQYDYTNPALSSDTAQVSDLPASIGLLRFSAGARLRLLRTQRVRLFVGGGGTYGGLAIVYDKDKFQSMTGSSIGFKDNDGQNIVGGYYEAGLDFILTSKYGMRLLFQKSSLKTGDFKTFNNKAIAFQDNYISLNYMQYIDTK